METYWIAQSRRGFRRVLCVSFGMRIAFIESGKLCAQFSSTKWKPGLCLLMLLNALAYLLCTWYPANRSRTGSVDRTRSFVRSTCVRACVLTAGRVKHVQQDYRYTGLPPNGCVRCSSELDVGRRTTPPSANVVWRFARWSLSGGGSVRNIFNSLRCVCCALVNRATSRWTVSCLY